MIPLDDFELECINNSMVADGVGPSKSPNITDLLGRTFIEGNEEYVLAQTAKYVYRLINLKTGNRVDDVPAVETLLSWNL